MGNMWKVLEYFTLYLVLLLWAELSVATREQCWWFLANWRIKRPEIKIFFNTMHSNVGEIPTALNLTHGNYSGRQTCMYIRFEHCGYKQRYSAVPGWNRHSQ